MFSLNNCKIFTAGLKGPPRLSLKVKLIFVFILLADIAQRYRISKYPTLKLFRNGMMMKREYRGQRSVKALADYIRQQKSDPIQELHDLAEITTPDVSHWLLLDQMSIACLIHVKRFLGNQRIYRHFLTVHCSGFWCIHIHNKLNFSWINSQREC